MYNWRDLTKLAVRDMCARTGTPYDENAEFHYMGGLDASGAPFIRLDLTPMEGSPELRT